MGVFFLDLLVQLIPHNPSCRATMFAYRDAISVCVLLQNGDGESIVCIVHLQLLERHDLPCSLLFDA